MSVILLILKIIGIILLVLLGILLTVICLVLFVPIRYRLNGEITDEKVFNLKVTWLLHLISWSANYEKDEFHSCFRIFGIRKKSKSTLSELEEETAEAELEETEPEETEPEETEPEETVMSEQKQDVSKEQETMEAQECDTENGQNQSALDDSGSYVQNIGFFRRLWQRCRAVKQAFAGAKTYIGSIKTRLYKIKIQISDIKSMLTDQNNKIALACIWEEVRYLFRHFKFRRIDAELSFAFDDPAATGQALGALSMLPFLYRYHCHIYPDFEADERYVRGNFFIQGRVRPIHLIKSVVRLLGSKETRVLFHKLRNF